MEKSKVQFIFEKDHVSGELHKNYEAFLLLNHWRKQVMHAAESVAAAEKAIELGTKDSKIMSRGAGQIKMERNGKTEYVTVSTDETIEMLRALAHTRSIAYEKALQQFNAIDLSIIEHYDISTLMDEVGGEQFDPEL